MAATTTTIEGAGAPHQRGVQLPRVDGGRRPAARGGSTRRHQRTRAAATAAAAAAAVTMLDVQWVS